MNIFQNIAKYSQEEIFDIIIKNKKIKIERIISFGQITPIDYWYDQSEDEFVLIIEGNAKIEYIDRTIYELKKGDYLYIKAHTKHRVIFTANPTIWLAVFV
jgi:cupin 2 domain-containing protein